MALATRRPAPYAAAGADADVVAAIRHFATGVTVLTCGVGEDAEGVTVSTFSTVPGHPPMACVALRSGSRALRAMAKSPTFVANGLAAEQEALARHFARRTRPSGLDQLPAKAWLDDPAAEGVPRLSGAVAWLECRPERTVTVSDHELLIARVVSAVHRGGTPLVTFAGELHSGPSTPTARPRERD
ncbi:flavin reductase family protein [Streptomyces spectabilis]|uniref:Flavin reductase n=1 Tax=Streptomyces spectabilis TaxID=68270 RepID=A0A516R1Y1_STRST|nr:flavin reductase family protein [Streptomyces spectabilis]QDQ09662.1 flavin reductase [Streptomyces spectabilis]